MSAVRQILLGLTLCVVAVGPIVFACGGSEPLALSPLMRCKLEALKILPHNPRMLTPYDLDDVAARYYECFRAVSVDGGAE